MKKFITFFVLCLMATININAQTYYDTELTDVCHFEKRQGVEVCTIAGEHSASVEFFKKCYILKFDRCFEYNQCFIFKDKEELCKTLTLLNNITKGGFFIFPDGTTFNISVHFSWQKLNTTIVFNNRHLPMGWAKIDKETIKKLLEKLEKFEES